MQVGQGSHCPQNLYVRTADGEPDLLIGQCQSPQAARFLAACARYADEIGLTGEFEAMLPTLPEVPKRRQE